VFSRPTWRSRTLYQVLATVCVLPFALPLFWIVQISFSGSGPVENYSAVIVKTPFFQFFLNSVVIAASAVVIVFVCTMLAGYALAKLGLRGRNVIFMIILAGLMVPAVAMTVPYFLMVRKLDLFNNYLAVIVPLCAGILPMTVLLTRNYLVGVPNELLEAAKIDGAGTFRTLIRIVIPLSKPIIAVVMVWSFLQAWNNFFLPLIMMPKSQMQTITQIPTYFTSAYGSDIGKIFAALTLICIPIVILYLAFQKYFEQGLTAGAVK